jgi:hypothetical protein
MKSTKSRPVTIMGTSLHRTALAIMAALVLAGQTLADEEYRSPRAGEAYSGTVFGHQVDVPARDRTKTMALDLGVLWFPDGPDKKKINPFGTIFIWRNWNDGRQRCAPSWSALRNVHFDFLPSHGPRDAVTFENLTLPLTARSTSGGSHSPRGDEVVPGPPGRWRRRPDPHPPGHRDNALEAALSYEAGSSFAPGDEPIQFRPSTTPTRVIRFRADAIERNFIELA